MPNRPDDLAVSVEPRQKQGVASDEARAATASRPSPAVLGQAGIANAGPLFPFTLKCDHRGWSDHSFRQTFMDYKPRGMSWYAYDVIVTSPSEVEFVAYGIFCPAKGGVGDEITRFKADVPASLTCQSIKHQAERLALAFRKKELAGAENLIVSGYAAAIIAAQGTSAGTAETRSGSGRQPAGPVVEDHAPDTDRNPHQEDTTHDT